MLLIYRKIHRVTVIAFNFNRGKRGNLEALVRFEGVTHSHPFSVHDPRLH